MNTPRELVPQIGLVVAVPEDQLVLSYALLFQTSKLQRFFKVINESGLELKKGDKICYLTAMDSNDQSVIVKKVVASNFPIASTIGELLSQIKINITHDEKVPMDQTQLQTFMQNLLGVHLNFTTKEEANLNIDIESNDEGTLVCPHNDFLAGVEPLPFNLKVPIVSEKTLTFMRLVSKPVYDDRELEMVVLSFRILHALFHSIGYKEHVDLESMVKEYEALLRGDPLLAKPMLELSCLMSWQSLHLLAGKYNPSKGPLLSAQFQICSNCEKIYQESTNLGLKDLYTMTENLPFPTASTIVQTMQNRDYHKTYDYTALYVLQNVSQSDKGVFLGVSPIRFDKLLKASKELSSKKLEESLFAGFTLFVPLNLIDGGSVDSLKKGLKVLAEIENSPSSNEEEYCFSKIRILEVLNSELKIVNASDLLHRFGLKKVSLTVKINWGSSVNRKELSKAASQVERLTEFKVKIDKTPDPRIDSIVSKMNAISKSFPQMSPEEIRELIHKLQNLIEEIQPTFREVLNKPVLTIFILPSFQSIPISTIGNVAAGEAMFRMYVLLTMPSRSEFVHLASEVCRNCFNNYTQGQPYKLHNIIAVFLIHELLHITSGLKDHRGECSICYFSTPEMLPLRLKTCDECIHDCSNQVHINCLMSYACLPCIAYRLDTVKNYKDLFCEDCSSQITTPSNYVPSYFSRIDNAAYREVVKKYRAERYDLILKRARHLLDDKNQ